MFVVQLPAGVDRDGVIGRLGEAGVAAKVYLPCIHLQPFYRERFGYSEGDFPIARDVAARSVALPFFTTIAEPEVERVATALEVNSRAVRPVGSIRCQLRVAAVELYLGLAGLPRGRRRARGPSSGTCSATSPPPSSPRSTGS